jgi:hypothetical protein
MRAALRPLARPARQATMASLRALTSGNRRETLAEKNNRLREASEAKLEETRQQLWAFHRQNSHAPMPH